MRFFGICVVWGAFQTVTIHGESVTQPLPSATKTKGEAVTLTCNYDTTWDAYTLYWYRQYPGMQPEFTMARDTNEYEKKAQYADARFSIELNTATKFTSLRISGLDLSDSAVYYCALRRTVMETS